MENDLFIEAETVSDDVDYEAELVGEGKKFKTSKDLARGKFEADKTIEVMKRKLDELQSDLKTKASMEQLLTEIRTIKTTPTDPLIAPVTPPVTQGTQDNLEARLEELLTAREAKRAQETNMEHAKRVLIEQFGDRANDVINRKAQENGLSVKALQELAIQSPTAFFNLLGVQAGAKLTQAGIPGARSHNVGQDPARVVRNEAFYEKMKRENPTQYFHKNTTVQQIKDATELGDAYFTK